MNSGDLQALEPLNSADYGLLRDFWYVACPARELKTGRSRSVSVCGLALELVRDTGPGRAVSGQTGAGDSLHVTEQDGLVWVFIPETQGDAPTSSPPAFDGPGGGKVRFVEEALLPCHIDDAAYGLLDPAHGPYVHASPIWRSSKTLKDKAKSYEPSELGFTMVPHEPVNSKLYNIIGGSIRVSIAFRLPGLRIERIWNEKHTVLGVTALTPIDANRTIIRQIFYWDTPVLTVVRPIARLVSRPFLQQDVHIMALRQKGLAFGAKGMLIRDADQLFIWYQRIKKEILDARAQGRAFVNPVKPATLRWRT
ncbi:aromatic ring-hydroxylating dioxygenase subunit alpha [Glycocaulis abyssi]|uniref:Aromatic ring-hydroxylating dioxygenase subunit alpha n=1 Tax=Glycocaulis abyssi TaxID=1433403 RepID=A0ABV9NDF4_9PROT